MCYVYITVVLNKLVESFLIQLALKYCVGDKKGRRRSKCGVEGGCGEMGLDRERWREK